MEESQVTEEELEDLRQKFHLLEGDRKAYYEMSMHTMKSNKALIQQVRSENKELRRGLAAIQRESKSASANGMTNDEQELKEEAVRTVKLRRKTDSLAGTMEEKQNRLQKMRDLAAGLEHQGAQPLEDDNPTTRRIRMLENRLDKAMIKYNEAQSIKKTYEQIVKRLREERVGFDNQLAAVERTLAAKEHDYQELILLSNDAQHADSVAKNELERVRNTYHGAKKARENDIRIRTEIVKNRQEVTQKMQDREKKKKQIIAERAEELDKELAEKAAKAKAETNAQENDNVNVFEDAFRKIKDATGVADVNEVIQKIVNQEDTQTNLMDLQKDNQTKIETLKGEKEKLKAKVDELKYSGTGNTHKRKMVDDSEENLSVAAVKLERVKDKYEKCAKKLLGVKAGVRHLAEKVDSTRDDDDQNILITDDTVVEAFYQVESLLIRLLKEVNRSKATSPKPNEQIAVAKNLTVMGISDREIMETRPYNQRVNLVSNNASGFDAFGLDDFGDDDDIGDKDDGEQLTREKIKKASSTLATQHDKSRKRKTTKGKHRRKSSAEGGLPPMS
eukprot:g3406.t1